MTTAPSTSGRLGTTLPSGRIAGARVSCGEPHTSRDTEALPESDLKLSIMLVCGSEACVRAWSTARPLGDRGSTRPGKNARLGQLLTRTTSSAENRDLNASEPLSMHILEGRR